MNIQVEIERDASIRGYAIWITDTLPDGTARLAKPVTLEFEPVVGSDWSHPTLTLAGRTADDFLQGFASALAASGFKTSELMNVHREIAAIKYHLEDMRTLVFKSVGGKE